MNSAKKLNFFTPASLTISLVASICESSPRLRQVPRKYSDLGRQFSSSAIHELLENGDSIEKQLAIGDAVSDAVVVYSDLKNFSSFVKAIQPNINTLNECMSKYYHQARNLVWQHGGVLDKFIGDAVLAIFNYPFPSKQATRNAVEFAADLIALGQRVIAELQSSINEVIESGTRVGVSSGALCVLNIGKEQIEVSFVGDVINLASRLEKACALDGILIENRTRTALSKKDDDFFRELKLKSKVLKGAKIKGQLIAIQSWQIGAEVTQGLVN